MSVSDSYPSQHGDNVLNESYELLLDSNVNQGMENLITYLQYTRQRLEIEQWKHFIANKVMNHQIRKLVHLDPFTFHSFAKPRGYAGDAALLDYMYGIETEMSPKPPTSLAREIFEYTTNSPAANAVKHRKTILARLLDEVAQSRKDGRVFAIASGHFREAELSKALRKGFISEIIALDQDKQSCNLVESLYGIYNVKPLPKSVRQIIMGRTEYLGKFDLVYAAGLFDYLTPKVAYRLLQIMFTMLKPKGKILVANFLDNIPDAGYMESFMAWDLIYRTSHEFEDLSSSIDDNSIESKKIDCDTYGNVVYLTIERN